MSLLNGGTNIVLPGLGLVISGTFILLVLVVLNIAFILFLTILKRQFGMK